MAKDVGLIARLTRLQVQEQVDTSSGMPPDYKGRIALDPTLLDVGRLEAVLETGGFELANTRVHQNLVLHHLGTSMHRSMIFLCEACCMVGNPYRLAELNKISWRDLQWAELPRESPVPVWEEVVEDEVTRVVTTVVLPDRVESSKEGSSDESMGSMNN